MKLYSVCKLIRNLRDFKLPLAMLVYICSMTSAVSGITITTLSDGSSEKELTFSESTDQTIYLKIPQNAQVKNAYLSLSGYSQNVWINNDDIVSGLGNIGQYSTPTVFQKDSAWYLITGRDSFNFTGYNWAGSAWQSNSEIVSGLEPFGIATLARVFNKDSNWYLIAYDVYACAFEGFNWSGSSWQSNYEIINGLGEWGYVSLSFPAIFQKDSVWYLISGNSNGTFKGYSWTGSTWQSDSGLVSGLGDIGNWSSPTVFQKGSVWYLIAGAYDGSFNGYKWTGSTWQSDSSIVSGLGNTGHSLSPNVFQKDSVWYLISGGGNGGFQGFNQSTIYPHDTYLETGVIDGTYEWTWPGLFDQDYITSDDFSSEINTYLSTCSADANGDCQVPLLFHSETAGTIEVSNINISVTGSIYVDDDAPNDPCHGNPDYSDPLEDGSIQHPYDAIQEGINAAFDGDTVVVLDGTYKGYGNGSIDFTGKAITVRSQNGPEMCIIDGENSHRCFEFASGEDNNSVIDGFSIINGYHGIGGGGITCFSSSPFISNCIFIDNSGVIWGGGMRNSNSNPTVINCTFANNRAIQGGGMYNSHSNPIIKNCTFSGNTAEDSGGGIDNDNDSSPVVINCILWGNTSPVGEQIHNPSEVTYSNVQGGLSGIGDIDADPCFVNPENDDYRLLPDSPCIDVGDPCYVAGANETDIEGNSRVINGRIDIGAYEYSGPFRLVPNVVGLSQAEAEQAIISVDLTIGVQTKQYSHTVPAGIVISQGPVSGTSVPIGSAVNLVISLGYQTISIYVDDDAPNDPCHGNPDISDPLENGSTQHPFDAIQEAIDAAHGGDVGDTVIVLDGIYTGNGNRDIDFYGKAITVKSQNGPKTCIIDCNGTEAESHRGFLFYSGEDANSIVDGFTIAHGWAFEGGGIYCEGTSPTIVNCLFSGNAASFGGGILLLFNNNTTLTNCTFIGNSAEVDGGGMFNVNESCPILTNCTFIGNSAEAGNGGGMYNLIWSYPMLTNCIFSGNSAEDGRGIYNYNSNPTLTNCILWDGGDEIAGDPAIIDYSDVEDGWPGQGNIDADPCFVNPSINDYHLLPNSPCIDAGDPNSDFGLEPEPDGGRINMGAYGNTAEATTKGGIALESYNLVERTRQGRISFDYVYTVTMHNYGPNHVCNVYLELFDAPDNVSIIDSNVTIDFIGSGESATSDPNNTFKIRVDRSTLIDVTTISWRATFEFCTSGGFATQAFTNNITLEPEVLAGDITGDGTVDSDDLKEIAAQWLQPPGTPSADIAPPTTGDDVVNFLDFAVMASHWLGSLD